MNIVESLFPQFSNHINTTNEDGDTPMMIAISTGNFELVQFLPKNDADLKMVNPKTSNNLLH